MSSPEQFQPEISNAPRDRSPVRRVMPPMSESSPYLDRSIPQHRQTGSHQFYSEDRPSIELAHPRSSRQQSPVFPAGRVILGGNQMGDQYSPTGMLKMVSTSVGRKQTLNERFASDDQIAKTTFKFEDNITIGIHRGPDASSVSPGPINRTFDPFNSAIHIVRRREEGRKKIFDREEIKQFQHDSKLDEFSGYEERRIISVVPGESQHHMDDRSLFHVQEDSRTDRRK